MVVVDKQAIRRKYLAERDKRLRPDGNDQYLRLTGQFAHYLDDPYTPRVEREPTTDHRTVAFIGGGFAGLVTGARLREAGHRRADRGEGRRLRRHLVLEPLSRRAVRHRVDGVPAAARGNRAHADREVRARAGDPRALPTHRQAVRPLRRRAVPHRGDRSGLGRGAVAVDRAHQPGRRVHRPVRRDGHRPAARAQAARHSGYRVVRRPLVPHQPLGLRLHRRRPDRRADDQARRQAGRDHRHRRDRGAVRAAPRSRLPRAVRLPAHAVLGRRARQPADRPGLVRPDRHARLAAALAGELLRQPDRRQRRARTW